ncbi:MAG: hypothetical protein IT388_09860 [Nitrospirales bacterium]|nr:hypothetical protein [Nitrospirales bacterium]
MANRQNYALKMELKKQAMLATGLLSNRFPEVSGMVIQMTYYQKGSNPVLMVRTVNVFPSSYAYFKMDCVVKGCEGGGFDLTSLVTDLVKFRRKMKKGTLVCSGASDILESAHASIAYEIVIHYHR